MRSTAAATALGLVLASTGCFIDIQFDDSQPSSELPDGYPASCEALVDHRIAECPAIADQRLFDIEMCERDRRQEAPIGCSRKLADYVVCQTSSSVDCQGNVVACEDELNALRLCRQSFTQETLCSHLGSRDETDCGDSGRYSFSCPLRSTPPPLPADCMTVQKNLYCCDSFDDEDLDRRLFIDPVFGPDELPPDNSGIDFTDAAMCLDFSQAQGWGRCATGSACACERCAAEVRACALDYSCLYRQRCPRGGGCSGSDPFFTGYGGGEADAALTACMQEAGCVPKCDDAAEPFVSGAAPP